MPPKKILRNPVTNRKIKPLGKTAIKLYKSQIEGGANPQDVLPPQLLWSGGKIKKRMPGSAVPQNVRRITYDEIDALDPLGSGPISYLRNILKTYQGQTIQLAKQYYEVVDGELKEIRNTQTESIPTGTPQFSKWWKQFSKKPSFLYPDSEKIMFDEYFNQSDNPEWNSQLTIMSANKVGKSNYQQYFLDGNQSHCLFQPILSWATERVEKSTSKTSYDRYNRIVKQCEKLSLEYSSGVPENKLQEICDKLKIGIKIDVPSYIIKQDTKYINYECAKQTIRKFRFINTRLNHIELNEITNKDDYEEVSQEELISIQNNDKFCLWKGEDLPYQVNTLNKVYKLTEKEGYRKELKEFEELNKLRDFKIEHYSNKELSEYLLDNVNSNQSRMFNEDIEGDIDELTDLGAKHIDMTKAYARGSDCCFYKGYLGKITDFRKTDKIMGLGIYMIDNIKNIPEVIKQLGVLYDQNSYSSPELEFYKSLGITFDIVMGCWGTRTDIDFGSDFKSGMFLKDEDGLSHYCKWSGCLMKLSLKETFNFDCDNIEFAQLNNISETCDIRYNQFNKTGFIEYEKERAYHSAQIATFICSYCRISMIEQLLKFKDISQIIAVQVDGIYYSGEVEIGSLFREKPVKEIDISCHGYIGFTDYEYSDNIPDNRIHHQIEVHTGPGGVGKTHDNLTDKGLVNILYVAPPWKLARAKQKEYKIDCNVVHYLIREGDDYLNIVRNYNVLIIDEISMVTNKEKELIIKRFAGLKIIFCGDLGYQLPPVNEGDEFEIGLLPEFKHTRTSQSRCKCEKLQGILDKCRKVIDLNEDDRHPQMKKIIRILGFEIGKKEDIDYQVEDLIITKTHKNKDYYTEKYKHLHKYKIEEKTKDYSNGDIIIGPQPIGVKSVLQHAFTVHSIQGETASTNLFIDINRMDSMRMLYTSLSRAKYLSQIIIIE